MENEKLLKNRRKPYEKRIAVKSKYFVSGTSTR
jgi:hypothetical protein